MTKKNILFIGKRFNTNRDALLEKFGRNYQFPLQESESFGKYSQFFGA